MKPELQARYRGLVLLVPPAEDRRGGQAMSRHLTARAALGILVLLALGCLPALRREREVRGDWPAYGNDAGGTRYSPAGPDRPGNVGSWGRLDVPHRRGRRRPARRGSTSPSRPRRILVDGTLFLSTPFNRVIALDPKPARSAGSTTRVDRSAGSSRSSPRAASPPGSIPAVRPAGVPPAHLRRHHRRAPDRARRRERGTPAQTSAGTARST